MASSITLTALVAGMPPLVHGPELRAGETQLQFLVRHHAQSWDILIERMKELGASARVCEQLQVLNTQAIDDPIVVSACEQWANSHHPSHYRTLKSLSNLQRAGNRMGIELVQILYPREKNPSGDTSAERMASEMGAEVVSWETGAAREVDYAFFLPRVKGNYLWLVPGGSRITAGMVAVDLGRVLSQMESNPSIAVYFDGSYSLVYRVSALKEIAAEAGRVPLNQDETTRLLQEKGYSAIGDRGPESALCEFEQIYGGRKSRGR